MTYSPAFDTVVSREAAWFTTDPPASFPTCPPLLASNGGAWDVVQGYWQAVDQRTHELYIVRTKTVETRAAMGGMKDWTHTITLYLYWPVEDPEGSLETEQQAFDSALADVMTRIRGPMGDKTHGGAFETAGEGSPSDTIDVRISDVPQAMASGQPLEAQIIYTASDTFFA